MKYEWRLDDKNQPGHHSDQGQDLQSSAILHSRFNIFSNVYYPTSILPKVSLRKILAKMTVNIGLADKIIFWTERGICCRAK